jgi:hypothetical protein
LNLLKIFKTKNKMSWKNWPKWVRGGFWGILIGILIFAYLIYNFPSGLPLVRYHDDIYGPHPVILVLTWPLFIPPTDILKIILLAAYYFVLGVFVEYLYGKIKNHYQIG